MGFDDGQIILNSPSNTYYAGQTVHGRLKFSRDKVKKFRGIYAHMRGYCKVHWTSRERNMNSRSDHDRYRTVNHDAYEDYFDQRVYLAGSSSGDHQLQPGDHDLPFSIRIPENCPSPIEGEYGHVRYELRVVVDRALKIDQELKVPIRIISPLDLNMVPFAREPINMKIDETYCCWCISAGSSETIVKLPASGYCAGQVMPVEVSCVNRSTEEIYIELAVKKEITFRAQSVADTRRSRSTMMTEKRGPVPPHVTRGWTVDFIVPETDVYNFRGCSFIDVEYELKITVSPDGCHDDTEDSCNIVFGTVALGEAPPMQVPYSVAPTQTYPQAVIQQPYPSAYPGSPYQPNQPYPSPNPQYPIPTKSPYPAPNPSYPSPYPPAPQTIGFQTSPNPIGPSYPPQTSPNPIGPSYLPQTSPNPISPSFPPQTSPYPLHPQFNTPGRTSPYPNAQNTGSYPQTEDKNGVSIPLLPTGSMPMPAPASPFAASAPEPSTPDDHKPLMPDGSIDHSQPPPYNPAFINQKTN